MKKIAVHFGAGALGRGLVIPCLSDAGYEVIAVDADHALISQLTARGGYEVLLTDNNETRHISLAGAVHSADGALADALAQAALITTSVRKENLRHVAAALKSVVPKTVICCENIERSGDYFASLLMNPRPGNQQQGRAELAAQGWFLPDCMVDRICSAQWPASLAIESESYGAVVIEDIAGAEVPRTFEKTAAITARFQEKRILVNTYADGIAFLGRSQGLEYLYQAASSREANQAIAGYMRTARHFLQVVYGFDADHLDAMAEKHRKRLSNPAIKRPLETVARDFLRKITAGERFIHPLTELMKRGEKIDDALPFLHTLIDGWVKEQRDPADARRQVSGGDCRSGRAGKTRGGGMNEIIFAAHGLSATAMEDSVSMVLGQRDNFHTLALTHEEGIDEFRRRLTGLVEQLRRTSAGGILLLTDMPAGTPYNLSVQLALADENVDVLSGTNFPMVLTALDQSDLPLAELTELVMETGREAINRFIAKADIPEDF